MAKVTLKVIEGDLSAREFSFIEPATCLIGRAKDCHIQLIGHAHQQYISRHHCELIINPPHVKVRDIQSKNGTYVNNHKITERFKELGNGDQIALGHTVVFRVEIEPASLARAEAPTQLQRVAEATRIIHGPTRGIAHGPWQPRSGQRNPAAAAVADVSTPKFSLKYFGFRRKPFQGIGLDFLRAYPEYDGAYTCLLDAVQTAQDNVILLLGVAGTGKTLLLRNLVQDPTVGVQAVLCQAPRNYDQLLAVLCAELNLTVAGVERPHRIGALMNYIKTRHGERLVVLIDEADGLEVADLNSILGLGRLGLVGSLVLAGSPGLKQALRSVREEKYREQDKQAYPFAKHITEIELKPMNPVQVVTFIRQQLHLAGGHHENLFPKPVLDRIARYSGGIPSSVNALCNRALALVEAAGEAAVSVQTIDAAADQLEFAEADDAVSSKAAAARVYTAREADAGPGLDENLRMPSARRRRRPVRRGRWVALITLLLLMGAAGYFFSTRYFGWEPQHIVNAVRSVLPLGSEVTGSASKPVLLDAPSSNPGSSETVIETNGSVSSNTEPSPERLQQVAADVAASLRQGNQALQRGEVGAARSAYEAAARAGDAQAMLAVGETYDPVALGQQNMPVAQYADPAKAAEWYLAAFRAGHAEAAGHLSALRQWMAQAPAPSATVE